MVCTISSAISHRECPGLTRLGLVCSLLLPCCVWIHFLMYAPRHIPLFGVRARVTWVPSTDSAVSRTEFSSPPACLPFFPPSLPPSSFHLSSHLHPNYGKIRVTLKQIILVSHVCVSVCVCVCRSVSKLRCCFSGAICLHSLRDFTDLELITWPELSG